MSCGTLQGELTQCGILIEAIWRELLQQKFLEASLKTCARLSGCNFRESFGEKALRNRDFQTPTPTQDPLSVSLWWDLGISHFKSALNALICTHHTNVGVGAF